MTQKMYLIFFARLGYLAAGSGMVFTLAEVMEYPKRILFWGTVLSLFSLGLGILSEFLELGYPKMVPGVLDYSGTGIFLKFVSIMLFEVCLLLYLFAQLKDLSETFRCKASYASAFFALVLLLAFGGSFYMERRPAWDTYALYLLFIDWRLSLAGFVFAAFSYIAGSQESSAWRLALLGTCMAIFFTMIHFIALPCSSQYEVRQVAFNCFTSSYVVPIWWGIAISGFVIPLTATLFTKAKLIWVNAVCIFFSLIGTDTPQWSLFQLGRRHGNFSATGSCAFSSNAILGRNL